DIYQGRTPAVTEEPDSDDYIFRGPLPRRMTAEQFVDAVWQLTGTASMKSDAQVVRAKLKANDGSAASVPPLAAKWIWSTTDADKAPAGQTITFRRQFKLASAPTKAVAVVTCDNEYRLFLNGKEAAADDNWESLEV